jgi:hypothetical protein
MSGARWIWVLFGWYSGRSPSVAGSYLQICTHSSTRASLESTQESENFDLVALHPSPRFGRRRDWPISPTDRIPPMSCFMWSIIAA